MSMKWLWSVPAVIAVSCLLGGCGGAPSAAGPRPQATAVVAVKAPVSKVSASLCPSADLEQASLHCRRAVKSVSTGKLGAYYVVYTAPGRGVFDVRTYEATVGQGAPVRGKPLGKRVTMPTGSGAYLLYTMFVMTRVKPIQGHSYIIELDGASHTHDAITVTVPS